MSKTSKSPKKIMITAFKTARSVLPDYWHKFSPQKFTLPQLFACLVLRVVLKTDYRGVAVFLEDCPDLCNTIGLKTVPHFTTLHKASQRLLRDKIADKLLINTIKRLVKDKDAIELAAIDSTGLDSSYVSRYFVRRRRSKHLDLWEDVIYKRFPKLAIVCDCSNHAILSAMTTRGPSVDINQFRQPLKPAAERVEIEHLLADAGYDSEANHTYAREVCNIETTIPPKHGRPTTKLPKTKYRRLMRTNFKQEIYGQRWQVETVFSMIKRNFGSAVRARNIESQAREMMMLVLTHNIAIIQLVRELFYRACPTPFLASPLFCHSIASGEAG
jgi:transposase